MTARAGTGVNKKRTSSQRVKEEEKREKTEKLNAQKSALGSKLAAVDALRSGFEIPAIEGREVEHVQYGTGKVIRQDGAVITVQYGDMTKKQKLPLLNLPRKLLQLLNLKRKLRSSLRISLLP